MSLFNDLRRSGAGRVAVDGYCIVGFSRCRIHHIRWWSRGGRTVLDNLIPLCEQHYHLVHEGGWNLHLDHRRQLTWIKPGRTTRRTDHGPNRPPPPRRQAA